MIKKYALLFVFILTLLFMACPIPKPHNKVNSEIKITSISQLDWAEDHGYTCLRKLNTYYCRK
jgi:hypothetical protein